MLGMIDNFYGTVFVLDGAFIVAEMFRDFFQGGGYNLQDTRKAIAFILSAQLLFNNIN